jgi:hypothetical protein
MIWLSLHFGRISGYFRIRYPAGQLAIQGIPNINTKAENGFKHWTISFMIIIVQQIALNSPCYSAVQVYIDSQHLFPPGNMKKKKIQKTLMKKIL